MASLRVAAEKAGQSWCDPLDQPWLAGEHRLCSGRIPQYGVFVIGSGDAAPVATTAEEILNSPKGRVYLIESVELLQIATITDAGGADKRVTWTSGAEGN